MGAHRMANVNWFTVNRKDAKVEAGEVVSDAERFFPFPDFEATDDPTRNVARFLIRGMDDAIDFIETKVKLHAPCNACFKRLPGGRTFREIWEDKDVWIHYNGRSQSLGFRRPGTKEIAVCFKSFQPSVNAPGKPNSMQVAATIVHELAHVGGAEGDSSKRDNSAENTLRFCLLTQMFKPDVFGAIDQQIDENRQELRTINA
jgi:hypothetical protein